VPERLPLTYRILRRFVRFWINRFFRDIQVTGRNHVPAGSAIFAMNHPNNLIDSLLAAYAINRRIHFLATARIFRNPILSAFLRNAGVIPVYRKQDDTSHSDKNVAMFQACYEILGRGGAIGIYPEGRTHAEPRVQKIKTGAARIALETENQFHPKVRLVPIGLNFSARKSFRAEVFISIGEPIAVENYLSDYLRDPVETVEKLTAILQRALETEVLHVELPELDKLVQEIEEIYKGELIRDLVDSRGREDAALDEFRLSKKLVEGIQYFNRTNPELVRTIQQQVHAYQSRLRKLHLQDRTLQEIAQNQASYRSFVTQILLLGAGLIPAAWGILNHFFPYQISRWLSRRISKTETDYATVRILSGILLYSIFYTVQIYVVLRNWGWTAAFIYGVTLPMFGGFAYYYLEKYKKFRGSLQLAFVFLTRKKLIGQLIERRRKLIQELDLAKDEYVNAHLQTR
jgi:glycerol-3-phosphate O-acyltransferase / dihydroxyacetone phosphate acyltransferase